MSSKSAVLAILLIGSFGLSGYLYYDKLQLEEEILSLNALVEEKNLEINYLETTYEELENSYKSMKGDYDSLEVDYGSLQGDYESLQVDYGSLQVDYGSLQDDYESLQDDFGSLQYAHQLRSELSIGSNLTSFYDLVRYENGLDGTKVFRCEKDMVEFLAKLAYHDLGHLTWPGVEDRFFDELGKHSHEAALKVLQTAISATGSENSTPLARRWGRYSTSWLIT